MMESLLALAQDQGGGVWLPPPASTAAGPIDDLFMFIVYLCTFFFILIVGVMGYFVVKYRRKSDDQPTSPNEGNLKLEIAWSVVPAILLVVIFVWGFKGFIELKTPPGDTIDIRVRAQKWAWQYEYPNGVISDKLVVPVDKPVKLIMSSEDVIHSFYVADFRIKQDVLPSRYTVTWFEATEPGVYNVQCTEYCGDGHSLMRTYASEDDPSTEIDETQYAVDVRSTEDYQAWLDAGGPLGEPGLTPVEKGEILVGLLGCKSCHNLDGTDKIGPALNGLYGSDRIPGGPSESDNYIRESILEPMAYLVPGYDGKMPTYKGRIKEEELDWVIDYLKSIGN